MADNIKEMYKRARKAVDDLYNIFREVGVDMTAVGYKPK